MEAFLPGLGAELVGAGAVHIDGGSQVGFLVRGGFLAPHRREVTLIALSRDLLDFVVRRRVAALPNVQVLAGQRVAGVCFRDRAVRGVRLAGGSELEADLVVDAMGRGSRLPTWLAEAGLGALHETVVDAGFGYSTVWLDRLPELPHGWKLVTVSPTPESPRGGVVMQVEGGRGVLSLNGPAGSRPPHDPAGLVDFARRLRTPILADVLASAGAIDAIETTRSTVNRFRHFWRGELPLGLLSVGDAASTQNPIYAQGMTVAARTLQSLSDLLASGSPLERVGRDFARAQARASIFPWLVATLEDLRFEGTRGRRPPGVGLAYAYLDRLFAAGTRDADVAAALQRVILLMDSPAALFALPLVREAMRAAGPGRAETGAHVVAGGPS